MSRLDRPGPDPEERRRLFRKMEWAFVYWPPLLILFISGFGSALLAWVVPVPGVGFWGKWVLGMVVLVGAPLLVYFIRSRWSR